MQEMIRIVFQIGQFLSNWTPTYFILASLCVLLLALLIKREIVYQANCWLSTRIEKSKQELRAKAFALKRRQLPDFINQLYYPTFPKVLILVVFLATVFGWLTKALWLGDEFYQQLVPIQIGIVALIFPVMIFIIGFSGNKMASGVNVSEVLLRESYLFPAGVIGVFFLVNSIWARSSYAIIIQIFLSAAMYVGVLYKVIRVLLNDKRLLDKSKALLQEKLRRSIEGTIVERLGNNILIQGLGENKIELEYAFLDPEHKQEHLRFNLSKRGIITNIHLVNLEKIAKVIEEASRRNDFSFYNNSLDASSMGSQSDTSTTTVAPPAKTFKENKKRFLRKRFMDEVTDESPCVLSIEKNIITDQTVIQQIQDLVLKTFKIRIGDEEDDKLRIELRNLKDQLLEDIRNKRLGRIDSLREIYLSLAELFLDVMKDYASNYTMEMAQKERSNFTDEWPEVRWITEDLRDIYEAAVQSHDSSIIKSVGYLPLAIAHRAIKVSDHYIFQKTFGFLSLYYIHAIKEPDTSLREFMKERCAVYLRETADYFIQYELPKIELGEEKIRQYKDFAIEILMQLQRLLKHAYDAKDSQSFDRFLEVGSKLFSHFKPSQDHPNAEHLKWALTHSGTSQEEKTKVSEQLKQREFLEGIEIEIRQRREELFFGLASFILSEYQSDTQNKERLKFFQTISPKLPNKANHLTEVFLRCHNFKTENFWGWEWWILPDDGEAHFIDFMGKTVYLYCVKIIEIIRNMSEADIEKITLPHSRDLVHLTENTESPVRKAVESLVSEQSPLKDVVQPVPAPKKVALFKAFDSSNEKQARSDDDFLISAPLSKKKLSEFLSAFLDSYQKNSGMYAAFKKYGDFKSLVKKRYKGPEKSRGYNRLDEKAAFIDEWHVSYSQWGEQYGSGMAVSENTFLFEALCQNLPSKSISKTELIDEIEKSIEELIVKKHTPNVIVTSLDFDDYGLISGDGRFIPHWHKDCPKLGNPNYQGILKLKSGEYPIIRLYREKKKGAVAIFNLNHFSSFSELNPTDHKAEEKDIHERFLIQIIDLNVDDKVRSDIIAAAPEWLNKYQDKDRYLRTKVVIKTFMRNDLKIKDRDSGILLKINDSKRSAEAKA